CAATCGWGCSSVGRALDWQSRGRRFDPVQLHHFLRIIEASAVGVCAPAGPIPAGAVWQSEVRVNPPRSRRPVAACAVLLLALASLAPAAAFAATIAEATRGLEKLDGFLPLYWDVGKGRVLVEVANLDQSFLYMTSLATGLGDVQVSLDLDRGATGTTAIGRFERAGGRLHLVIRSTRFQTLSGGPELARTVEESFTTSTLGAFEIVGESQGHVLADLTPLFLSDAIDVRGILRSSGQGGFQLDRERSRIHRPRTRAFPRN